MTTNYIKERVEEVWGIVKRDSLASSRIGSPADYTIERLRQALQDIYFKAIEDAKEDVRDCMYEHNVARHGNTPDDAYARVSEALNNLIK